MKQIYTTMSSRKTVGTIIPLTLIAVLIASLWLFGCSDDRTPPTKQPDPSYNETFVLLDSVDAVGADLSANYSLRDNITAGRLYLYGYLKPDADLNLFDQLATEIDLIGEVVLGFEGLILEIELKTNKTHQDSVELDSLHALKDAELAQIDSRNNDRDSLDILLDDRYKLSVWLDDDVFEYYPQATFIDGSVIPFLGNDLSIWGQGFYLSNEDDNGTRGMRIVLDLSEFWVADAGWENDDPYIPTALPRRGSTLPELYPIRDWLSRMTPNTSHTIHARFGAADTETAMSASLYVVYETAQ